MWKPGIVKKCGNLDLVKNVETWKSVKKCVNLDSVKNVETWIR